MSFPRVFRRNSHIVKIENIIIGFCKTSGISLLSTRMNFGFSSSNIIPAAVVLPPPKPSSTATTVGPRRSVDSRGNASVDDKQYITIDLVRIVNTTHS